MTAENRSPDRRVIKTKRAIKSAFAKLLSEKDINDITISDIAAVADINRKTFYNYYSGVHEVVDEMDEKVSRIKRPRGVSLKTALVYDGHLAKTVEADGYFDAVIDIRDIVF